MKRKRGETQSALVPILLLGFVFAIGFLIVGVLDVQTRSRSHSECFNLSEVTQITYGLENQRINHSDNPTVLGKLSGFLVTHDERLGHVVYKPLDIGVYQGSEFVGSMLFMQTEFDEWFVQINDGNRQGCGLYQIEVSDMTDFIVLAGAS